MGEVAGCSIRGCSQRSAQVGAARVSDAYGARCLQLLTGRLPRFTSVGALRAAVGCVERRLVPLGLCVVQQWNLYSAFDFCFSRPHVWPLPQVVALAAHTCPSGLTVSLSLYRADGALEPRRDLFALGAPWDL